MAKIPVYIGSTKGRDPKEVARNGVKAIKKFEETRDKVVRKKREKMLRGKDGLVIYFEDDKMLGKMYTIKLEKAGLSVLWEKHPTEKIISSLAEIRPDLIIMDIIMPVMDGWEATRRLKADERTKDIPVFGLSNMGAKENQEKACGLGMADYWLRAEHTPQEVADKVMELLKKK